MEDLDQQLSQLSTVLGITPTRVLRLPTPVREFIHQLLRQPHGHEATLGELAEAIHSPLEEAAQVAQRLVDKGYLYEFFHAPTATQTFKLRFGRRKGRELPPDLRHLLQDLKAVHLIEVISDLGASTTGAHEGPKAMRQAAFELNRKLFDHHPMTVIESAQYTSPLAQATPFAKGIMAIYDLYQAIGATVKQVLDQGLLPVVISGDHSTAGGTISGIKMAHPNARLGVVWIDAHADIHSPYTTPSGNMHGMPLATALAEDNLDQQVNQLEPTTLEYWNRLKAMGGIEPKIYYDDLIYVAVRDTEPQEDALITQHRVKNFTTAAIRQQGAAAVSSQILACLAACDLIYISFDVDSMDPAIVSEGTGTPVADGLTDTEVFQCVSTLIQSGKVCCFEICEINPQLDGRNNRMAQSAFNILEQATTKMSRHFLPN